MKKLLFIFGTRPEAIKLAPLIKRFQEYPDKFDLKICVSGQHREMLDQVLDFFNIKPDFDLNIMKAEQSLFDITVNTLKGIEGILEDYRPDWIFVQGDTTTTFVGSLAGYYKKIKIAHIEAGLRSFNKYSPYPEEINRVITSHLTDLHFAPTEMAKQNLLNESIDENSIHVSGNTVIDALFLALEKVRVKNADSFNGIFKGIDFSKRIILVTGHRRESFGRPFRNICNALKYIAENNNVEVIYPVHLNPNVRKPVFEILGGLRNVHLIEPLDYPAFVWLMDKSYLILTDSGGVQEEAPSLGKPVLVMRDVTERMEGVEAGTCRIVGTNMETIIKETSKLLENNDWYKKMATANNPYGDGRASERIVKIIMTISED